VFLFSVKTFSNEKQNSTSKTVKDNLAKKQLEIIIKSIKQDSKPKIQKVDS
jgi:hypothetical protein